jgi:hypothetical protein
MKRYRPKLPRAALGLTAVAMSALTFGTLVLLPAQQESACGECDAAASAKAPDTASEPRGNQKLFHAHSTFSTSRAS